MRTPLLFLFAACGNVKPAPSLVDAGSADASIGTPADAPASCPMAIAIASLPSWLVQGPFESAVDPAGSAAQVWVSNAHVPSNASLAVPFQAGDRITGLLLAAYGSGGAEGLRYLKVIYQPRPGENLQISETSDDLARAPQWGHVDFAGLQPTVLSSGLLVVGFDATEASYYLGKVTATFERPCPH